ncbi:Glutathione S-transferase zeta-1 [Balamuthia mandrillaris]
MAAASSSTSPSSSSTTDKKDDQEIVLYSYWRSSCSYRVRIALNHKAIPYTYKAVHLVKSQQLEPDYAALNPMKEVPSLLIDGLQLSQSVAILEYLEETRPEPRLLPQDPATRALVRQIVSIVCSDIQPVQNLRVLKYLGEERKVEWAKHWIESGFEGLERVLERSAGSYCVGDEVTLADAVLPPQVYNARRFGVDLDKYPTIKRVEEALMQLPAFQQARPEVQPDAE